jgi:hypothetical protein
LFGVRPEMRIRSFMSFTVAGSKRLFIRIYLVFFRWGNMWISVLVC